MRFSLTLASLVAVSFASRASAQNPPANRQQAEATLRTSPDPGDLVRQWIEQSRLTPAQIRARLTAAGYPAGTLDAYMAGGAARDPKVAPKPDVFAAVRALGIASAEEVANAVGIVPAPERPTPRVAERPPMPRSREIFGLATFRNSSSEFSARLDGPVDAAYRLGPGDQLVLTLTGDVQLSHTLDVTREGLIFIPDVGQVPVAGLTLSQLEDQLYARLGRAYSGVRRQNPTTFFSITVSRLRTIVITVAGDAMTPSQYRVPSGATAMTALYAAGGPSDIGSLRRVQVMRNGSAFATVDVYDYLLRGDLSKDARLEQGDVVFVPVHGPRIQVDGEVRRPATYELRDGEGLAQLIVASGGFTPEAGQRRVLIDRVTPPSERQAGGADRRAIDVPLSPAGVAPVFALVDGDFVHVPGIPDRVRDRITVNGSVYAEGPQGYSAGLTLQDALRRAGGLKPDAYLPQVHVSRLRPDSTRMQLRVAVRDTTGATAQAFALQPDDEITVYSRTTFRPDLRVSIAGAVRTADQFPWREGMTLRDLVLLAGGLQQGAYIREAEIARLPERRDAAQLATTIRVPIDSSYLFDRGVASASTAADTPLMPYDNVLIMWEPDWSLSRTVALTGEVKFPGVYTLKSKNERVADLIARAGGLTTAADVHAAFFSRAGKAVVDTGTSLAAQAAAGDERAPAKVGADRVRVGVEIDDAMRNPNGRNNLVLERGDSIDIPSLRQTVQVRGEVNVPIALVHIDGRSLGYYIDAAGGATSNANAKRAYVVQPNGRVEVRKRTLWLFTSDPEPKPGAIVVVPRDDKPPAQQGNTLALLGFLAQLTASILGVVAISKR